MSFIFKCSISNNRILVVVVREVVGVRLMSGVGLMIVML